MKICDFILIWIFISLMTFNLILFISDNFTNYSPDKWGCKDWFICINLSIIWPLGIFYIFYYRILPLIKNWRKNINEKG